MNHFIGGVKTGIARLAGAAIALVAMCLTFGTAEAATCGVKPAAAGTPVIAISNTSYCELCGYGYVTLVVSNDYDNSPTHTLHIDSLGASLSGMVYEPTAPNSVTYSVNGGPATAGTVSGTSSLTFSNLPDLDSGNGNNASTLTVTFAVRRAVNPEGLIAAANRQVSADIQYDVIAASNPTPTTCANNATATAGPQTVALREPIPNITKTGWNYDAGQRQGTASDPVYGNNNDDVVWRIRIGNTGTAALQDLRFDDLMTAGNMTVNYACPTQATADAVAANDGVLPGGSPCVAASNSINDFVVTNPFGQHGTLNYPWGASAEVDVAAGGNTSVYLVGKITANGSCVTSKVNTVSDVQWGCDAEGPAGGITTTSTGVTPGGAGMSATLYTEYMDGAGALTVNRQLTGVNTAQPVGTRGTMTITLTNNSRGSVKFTDTLAYHLRDVLPVDYVVDPTFTPTIAVTSPYGAYAGRVDTLTWTNPVAGTFPLTTTNPTVPLGNTAPEFKLTSSTTHPIYADQKNMMRQGDVVTVTFRVVLINSTYYDRAANLDVTPEANTAGAQFTDPPPGAQINLSNTLSVQFDTFCATQGTQLLTLTGNGTGNPAGTNIPAFPEDLDVAINGLNFILTNSPTQPLTLPVVLTNNGGHDAADYHLFVTFGATMDVTGAPAGCSPIALSGSPPQPAPWKVWVNPPANPIPLPSTATVYQCVSPAVLAPGQSVNYSFTVIKTSDPTRLAIDDLTFRADVIGEITLANGTPLWFPAPIVRSDGQLDRANDYSLDAVWSRVIGFNLLKSQVGTCNENNPPIIDTVSGKPVERVEIGEECTYHIETGGWFGFQTPGFTYIAVQNIDVVDQDPNGQAYISNTSPYAASTSLIKNVSLNPGSVAPLYEGWFDWRFNVADADQIKIADEWFRVNVTNRILNEALNTRAAPNVHGANSHNVLNSTFDATFQNNNTGAIEKYALGPSTIGYPIEAVRRVDVTVTEPNLSVVKEVCNETLYGTGPACSNWTTNATDGDARNTYLYRIRVTNEAASGGLARSPAYDVVVTDTLDASDLAYVRPLNTDGIDNDGDGQVDGGDADTEGTIGDNTVKNGVPATVTFSYTNSTALKRINAGQTVTLYYRVDFDDTAAPLQLFVNQVTASYDTLTGPSGNQTVVQSANATTGGARVYTTAPASATVQMLPVLTQPKKIVRLSNTPLAATSPQPVSVGEEIDYQLVTSLPVSQLRSFVITDNLPPGISCSQAPAINLSAPPYSSAGFVPGGIITPTCSASQVQWNFGDQYITQGTTNNRYDFAIDFIARVDNTALTNDGGTIGNGGAATTVTATYINQAGTSVVLNFGEADVMVKEPRIALTKSFSAASADAADVLTVTVTATNTGTATAYNLRVLDDLVGHNLTALGSVGGTDPPDVIDTTTLGANRPIFKWNRSNPKYAIAPGATRSFTFTVSVDTAAQPLEVLSNTIQASWQSLPGQNVALNSTGLIGADGSATGLRNGALPNAANAVNDYETTASATTAVPAIVMTKTDLNPAVVPAIGAHKNFQIEIQLPEGTTRNLVATDNLAATGLSYVLENNASYDITYTFQGIASINGQSPSEAALLAFPADNSSGTVTWNLGTVVTATENDTAVHAVNPVIRINYYARINNDLATNSGSTLRNSATVNYRNGATGGTQTLTASTATVTVVEPVLTASKVATNVTAGKLPTDPAAGGDTLQYVVTIPNAGNSTAYDVNVVDTLPAGLQLYTGFTPTATIGGVAVAGFVATPANAPGGPLIWGRGNGDGSLDVPAGQSLVLTYRVVVQQVGGSLSNSVWVDWTSLDGSSSYERTGAGCPVWTAPNKYCTGPAVATVLTQDTTAFAKAYVSDTYNSAPLSTATDAIVRVGDVITYRLAPTLRGGLTNNVVVRDTLPAGMAFVDVVSINGDTTASYSPPASGAGSNFSYAAIPASNVPAAGQTGMLTWTLGNINNDPFGDPTTDTLVILYRARVMPDAGIPQVASTTLTNNANLNYTGAATALPGSATVTLRQPIISAITKTDRSGRVSGVFVNVATDVMNFRLQACNSGQAPAYSVLITDTLATQLNETSIRGPVNGPGAPDVSINGSAAIAGTDYVYTPPASRGGNMVFRLNTGMNPGQCVTIDYDIGFHTDFGANQVWANSIILNEYWSLPALSGQRYAAVGPTTFTMQNVATTQPPTKTVFSPAAGEVTIGQEVVYRITVPGTVYNAAMYDVAITDVLNANLEYVSASDVSGNGFTLTDTTVPPGQVNLRISQIPAGKQAVIELHTRVRNVATAVAGTSFTNSAVYTYADTQGGATQGGGTGTSGAVRIIEPLLTLGKTVANLTSPGSAPNAGDILRYTLTFTAAGGAAGDNYSNAYDLRIADTLSLGLAYVGNPTVSGAGNTIGAPTLTGDGVVTAQNLIWSLASGTADIDVPEGSVVTVTYDVRVLDGVLANQVLSNSAAIQWTGLNGASAYERNGTGTPAYNNYFTGPVTATLTTPDSTTITKTRLTDTYGPADANVRVGDIVQYELRLTVQEGTLNSAVVTDTLPQGLAFAGVVSINGDTSAPYSAAAPFTYADIPAGNITVAGNPATGPSTVTWNLGNIVNVADNNPANDQLVLVYRARVLNAVLPHVNTLALTNSVRLNYNTATGAAPAKTSGATITLQQPNLTVTKSAAPAGGDNILVAGELVTYTVDIANVGTAPAYDTVLRDIIPVGMRNGAATITMVSTQLLSGAVLPNLAPSYSAATGVATWNFDTATANQYTIPAGDTLRVVYRVQADAGIGAGLTMTNQAQVQVYYSFDNQAVPSDGGVNGVREIYGPSNVASTTLTTASAGALLKQNPAVTTAAIGQPFKYRITVPATPAPTALYDVRILDNLGLSAASLSFVSVAKVSGSQSWTPVNTGTATNLVIEDPTVGIDIPAGEQVVIEVTVVLNDVAQNVSGLLFSNTASYTYNQFNGNATTQQPGGPSTTPNMTIVGPDTMIMTKTGPATMQIGTPGTFTLNVQNTGTGSAWHLTLQDQLPNPTPGGMCSAAPSAITARIYQADGVTPVSPVLVAGTDYTTSFSPDPGCLLSITLLTPAAVLPAGDRLIVTYQASLDPDNVNGAVLTNVAGATQWFSADPAGLHHTYTGPLTNGTVGTADNQDAWPVTVQTAVLTSQKTVFDVTTGQPGTSARPGDRLRYTITIQNSSPIALSNFSLVDELDRLNASAYFQPGTLTLVTVPAGADSSNTNASGGTKGSGVVDIRNLSIAGNGSLTVVFEATLVPVINNGTVVLNQGQVMLSGVVLQNTDDPAQPGTQDPTSTLIVSAPAFRVQKTVQDITSGTAIVSAGDTLRYTITVKNIGTENATGVTLTDAIPAFTTYVAGTTRLNGNVVTDPGAGVSALQNGLLINAPPPESSTAGYLRADATSTTANVATITFEVKINAGTLNGTIVSNQGFVSGAGVSSGPFAIAPSDDPNTLTANDPTRVIVGSLPLLNAAKTVALVGDVNNNGIIDAGDSVRYTITITNTGAVAATGVTLTDLVPANTSYVAGSTRLNGVVVPDVGGASALQTGMPVNSSGSASGNIAIGGSAVVTFDVQVNAGVAGGTTISNQGSVTGSQLPSLLTDADGNPANGSQPTTFVVGSAQQLAITKGVTVVGGGPALPGATLEYTVTVTNTGTAAATFVAITDDLSVLAGKATYVPGSATLNGSTAGVTYLAPVLTADYSTTYGSLAPGATATLRFRATIAANATGRITNTAQVGWNTPTVTASASVSIDIGAIPGTATLAGQVWHDGNFNKAYDTGEVNLAGWQVDVYFNGTWFGTTTTDAGGLYRFVGLAPTLIPTDQYQIRFSAPGATATTAMLGVADSPFINGMQQISNITAPSGSFVSGLNLPITPDGVIYNSITRTPVTGATVALYLANGGTNTLVAASCFDNPAQQSQVTLGQGYYKFDINFSDASCPAGGSYLIQVTPPATGYTAGASVVIAPTTSASTTPYNVPACPADALPAVSYCQAQPSELAPVVGSPGTPYYLHVTLNNAQIPGESQLFNNHIPIDPVLTGAVAITKTTPMINVSRGQLVPYTITIRNTYAVPLTNMVAVDTLPPGFKYVEGSGRFDGLPAEPLRNARDLRWENLTLAPNVLHTIKLIAIVGAGVGDGQYVNQAQMISTLTGGAASGIATAAVRVVPDPTFDCTDIIGKVFEDTNHNGVQDENEPGIGGVRVVSARGLIMTTDRYGRFHVTCAAVPNELRGSNFVLKVDERSLPSGYRITTDNPLVHHVTRGKAAKFNFGATIHHEVRLDVADGVFEPGTSTMRPQWVSRLDRLVEELRKGPSVLRLSYLADTEDASLVKARLAFLRDEMRRRWTALNCCYRLDIESETYWRRGAPVEHKALGK